MATDSLLLVGAVHVLTGLSFLAVGRTLSRRPTASVEARGAIRAGVAWWWGLGAYLLVQAGLTFVAALGPAPVGLFLAARLVTIPLLCVAVWGLTYHLAYLFTGRPGIRVWLALLYGAVAVAFYVASFSPPPGSVRVDAWLAELEGTGEGPLYRLVYVAVGLPPIAASVAYFTLAFRVREPLQRWRVVLLAGSILAWVGGGLVARLSGGPLLKFLTLTVLGLVAAGAVLLAYHPPAAVRRRLGAGPRTEGS